MFGLGMVSTDLYMLFYAGEIQNSGNGNAFFLNKRVRFARADKAVAVALQYHYNTREEQTPTYAEVLPWSLSVYEHKHTPILSTCPLHTNSGCGKEGRILIGP